MDLIERVGAVLGLAAFLGLAVLALLYFQQARDVRRLREWAGKAPERAAAAAQQSALARAEPAGEAPGTAPARGSLLGRGATRLRARLARLGARLEAGWRAVDHRSPLDLRVMVGLAAVAIGAAAALTGGFGLLGADEDAERPAAERAAPAGEEVTEEATEKVVEVAVLNGTSTATSPGVPGLAGDVGEQVEAAGYRVAEVADAQTPFAETLVMYEAGQKAAAAELASDPPGSLDPAPLQPMSAEVRELAGGAGVALVVGQEDADL